MGEPTPTGRDPDTSRQTASFWAITAAILILGLAFRLPGLSSRSLWIDELYSQWFSARSLVELWTEVPQYETHPPAYYTLLKLWTAAFGDSELGLRSLSLVASLATIAVIAVSGKLVRLGGITTGAGMIAALLLAVNFANIRDAQNVRPYALQALFCTLAVVAALVLLARLSRHAADRAPMPGWLAPASVLGVSVGCALWIHNTSLFIAFGIWCGLALSLIVTPAERRLRHLAIFVAAGLLALLVWAPYLPLFVQQSRGFSGLAFWLEPKARDLYSAWMLVLGESWPALAVTLVLLGLGLFRLSRSAPLLALPVVVILLLPLSTILALSFTFKPIYIQRLFAWMVPLALLVMAIGILASTGRRWLRVTLVLVVTAFATVRSVDDIDRPIDDWKAIVAEIAQNARPGDVVIATPAEGSIALGYYVQRQAQFPPVICIPGCYPQRHLPRTYMSNFGAPRLIEADRDLVDQALKTYRRVWLVQVSVQLYDPKNIVRSRIAASRTFDHYYGNALARVDLFD